MKDGMNAIVLMQPMGQPVTLFVPEINLEVMQGLVGGMIERVPGFPMLDKKRIDLWCNEEGRLHGFTVNFGPRGNAGLIVGSVFACANSEDGGSIGLTGDQHKLVIETLKALRR